MIFSGLTTLAFQNGIVPNITDPSQYDTWTYKGVITFLFLGQSGFNIYLLKYISKMHQDNKTELFKVVNENTKAYNEFSQILIVFNKFFATMAEKAVTKIFEDAEDAKEVRNSITQK